MTEREVKRTQGSANDTGEPGRTVGDPDGALRISDVSRLTGVPLSTLRVWEERGLLQPGYTASGYRVFNPSHVKQARDIKRLRVVQGLSITAIKAALRLDPNHAAPDPTTRRTAERPSTEEANPLGSRLRELRRAANFTMREVSRKTGVEQATLASIERTSLGVQIPMLQSMARLYGVTLTSLMDHTSLGMSQEVVTRAGKGKTLPTLGHGLRIEQLATGRDMMDCQRWFIEPGVHSHGSYSHDGEELIYVMLGEFEITLQDDRVHRLLQGDSIYFKSSWKHSWINPSISTAVLIWVNTPPSF